MYSVFLLIHSYLRWLVVVSLLVAIYRAYRGYTLRRAFSLSDNRVRHWTATIAHIQLMAGIIVYTQSPTIKYFWGNASARSFDSLFYAVIHMLLMLSAIILLTVGSALAKRK